jgi:hypothetical protein
LRYINEPAEYGITVHVESVASVFLEEFETKLPAANVEKQRQIPASKRVVFFVEKFSLSQP